MLDQQSDFRLPCTTVPARLMLANAEERRGVIYLAEQAETPLDMLNAATPFFPFRSGGDGDVWLVAKAQAVALRLERDAAPSQDPERLSAAKTVSAELRLTGGTVVTGSVAIELPEHQSRLLDYLNQHDRPFFAVSTDDAVYYVNSAHLLYACPQD